MLGDSFDACSVKEFQWKLAKKNRRIVPDLGQNQLYCCLIDAGHYSDICLRCVKKHSAKSKTCWFTIRLNVYSSNYSKELMTRAIGQCNICGNHMRLLFEKIVTCRKVCTSYLDSPFSPCRHYPCDSVLSLRDCKMFLRKYKDVFKNYSTFIERFGYEFNP